MTKFIVLSMFIEQEGGKAARPSNRMALTDVPFLQWKEGYQVASKGNRDNVFTIKLITSPSQGHAMTYQSQVDLVNEPGEEERTLRGSTLQSGYVFIGYGSVVEDQHKGTTKAIGVNVDKIRNWYPRKDGRPGCRVMLDAGVNYAVADAFEDIFAKVQDGVAGIADPVSVE